MDVSTLAQSFLPPCRSSTLPLAAHFFVWYFVADLFHMYNAVYLRKNLAQESQLWKRLWIYLKKKGPLVFHHIFLVVVAYPLGIVSQAQ